MTTAAELLELADRLANKCVAHDVDHVVAHGWDISDAIRALRDYAALKQREGDGYRAQAITELYDRNGVVSQNNAPLIAARIRELEAAAPKQEGNGTEWTQ